MSAIALDKYVFVSETMETKTKYTRTDLDLVYDLKFLKTVQLSTDTYFLPIYTGWYAYLDGYKYVDDNDFALDWDDSFEAFVAYVGFLDFPYTFKNKNHNMAVRLNLFKKTFFEGSSTELNKYVTRTFVISMQ